MGQPEDSDATYESPRAGVVPGVGVARRVLMPTLTVLLHPDPERVGERACFGERVELSRLAPDFRVGVGKGQPLADRALSRSPVSLSVRGGGAIVIAPPKGMRILVEGVLVEGTLTLEPGAIERGVVLELVDRIALLLHRGEAAPSDASACAGILGTSPAIERVREQILAVAPVDVPVLVTGETGTGKELAARALHDASARRNGPFVAVNMGAIAPSLASAELFGHARGAFSGAVTSREGLFREADGGTLFLDEIGEAPVEVQVMLLRALETNAIRAVGASATRQVDVRLVTATDVALEDAVAAGRFRAPLYHRIAGYEIAMPALREHPEDLGALLYHFLRQELAAFGAVTRLCAPDPAQPMWLSTTLMRRLVRHGWPGNVRELRNVARQLAVSGQAHAQAQVDPALERILTKTTLAPLPRLSDEAAPAALAPVSAVERGELTDERVRTALAANDHRLGRAAADLGVARNTLNAFIARSTDLRRARDIDAAEIQRALDDAAGDAARAAQALGVSERGLKLRARELARGVDGD